MADVSTVRLRAAAPSELHSTWQCQLFPSTRVLVSSRCCQGPRIFETMR